MRPNDPPQNAVLTDARRAVLRQGGDPAAIDAALAAAWPALSDAQQQQHRQELAAAINGGSTDWQEWPRLSAVLAAALPEDTRAAEVAALQWGKDWNNPDDGLGPLIEPQEPGSIRAGRAAACILEQAGRLAGLYAQGHEAEAYRVAAAELLAKAEKLAPAPPLVGEGAGGPDMLLAAQRMLRVKAGEPFYAASGENNGQGGYDASDVEALVASLLADHAATCARLQEALKQS